MATHISGRTFREMPVHLALRPRPTVAFPVIRPMGLPPSARRTTTRWMEEGEGEGDGKRSDDGGGGQRRGSQPAETSTHRTGLSLATTMDDLRRSRGTAYEYAGHIAIVRMVVTDVLLR